jgi:hypothetical protein
MQERKLLTAHGAEWCKGLLQHDALAAEKKTEKEKKTKSEQEGKIELLVSCFMRGDSKEVTLQEGKIELLVSCFMRGDSERSHLCFGDEALQHLIQSSTTCSVRPWRLR